MRQLAEKYNWLHWDIESMSRGQAFSYLVELETLEKVYKATKTVDYRGQFFDAWKRRINPESGKPYAKEEIEALWLRDVVNKPKKPLERKTTAGQKPKGPTPPSPELLARLRKAAKRDG